MSKAGCGVSFSNERRAMRMLLEQIYIFFIYILLFELALVTVLVVALFVALVITSRKLDNKKSTSLLDRQRCTLIFTKITTARHFCGCSSLLYLLYQNWFKKSNVFINFISSKILHIRFHTHILIFYRIYWLQYHLYLQLNI